MNDFCWKSTWRFCFRLSIVCLVAVDRLVRHSSRPLTEIEHRLAGRITTVLLDELRHAWKGLLNLRLATERTESNPRMAPLSSTGIAMTLMQFELSLNGCAWPIESRHSR